MAKKIAVEIFLILIVGFVLGLIGPFGTFEMPTMMRIAYWMTFGLAGYALFRPLILVGTWLSETLTISPLIGHGLAQLVAAIPLTLLVAAMISGFRIEGIFAWQGLGQLYFQVWLIGFLIHAFFSLIFRHEKGQEQTPTDGDAQPAQVPDPPPSLASFQPSFLDQLPPGFGPVLALKSEDHYVRAISPTHEALVLARLRDAITGLGETEGRQVHRSWWVARAAISAVRSEGRGLVIVLKGGTEVPVSRDNIAALKLTGWLPAKSKLGDDDAK